MARPRTYLAVLVALAAVALYALMWVGYRQDWHWLHRCDWSLLNAAHAVGVKHPMWVRFWSGVSFALGPVPLRLLGVLATVAALVMRNVRAALVLLACAPLSGLVTVAAKALAKRPRPSTMLVPESATSFPSGHALEATAALLAMVCFVLPMVNRSMGRVLIAVTGLSLLAIGNARVALNVHYPSDVLAGWSMGYLYFLLCLLIFRPVVRPASLNPCGGGHLITAQ
ncbi:MAG: phosphatase PAP2 family protein [Mycobacterium sp.]|uniref:phosphatase PAP2 family protein n=1 Tax=Mycobacterium sp. TaxID=1785 RepID=UPI001EBCAA3C|nr:phosphatase PAP2 family protein [Mycobacterium sp.]MBV8785283.1 phosphatase PAP2 family protein [Mycobacterium sp.]